MTTPTGPAERLTIYVGDDDRYRHGALYAEIVRRAHAAGLAGASAWKGFEGFGATHHVHTTRILSLSEDVPVMVQVIDTAERIDAFLPVLAELGVRGLVVREPVTVVDLDRPGAPA